MENKFPDRRKNYYIKKEFQRSFILKFLSLVIIGVIISGAIVYFMSGSTLTTTFSNSRLAIKNTAEYIFPTVLLSSVSVLIIIGMAAIVMTLFVSHKIAGPLYRIGKDIEELSAGDLNVRFTLRGGDEIKELAEKLDSMVRSLRSRATGIKIALDSLERSAGNASPEIRREIENLKTAVSKFNA